MDMIENMLENLCQWILAFNRYVQFMQQNNLRLHKQFAENNLRLTQIYWSHIKKQFWMLKTAKKIH